MSAKGSEGVAAGGLGFEPAIVLPTAKQRQMAAIRTRHTAPELIVRKALHAKGLRFRLHRRDLPGCPDIVLPGHRITVFVHGCFWHGCAMCDRGTRQPKSNAAFWMAKLDGNRRRDDRNVSDLTGLGWTVVIVWDCETRNREKLAGALDRIRAVVRPCLEDDVGTA